LSWETVSEELLATNSVFDGWQLSMPGNTEYLPVPGIVKLTLKLMDNAFAKGMNKLIIVYPERTYLPSLTVILQAVSDIISGRLRTAHARYLFQPGQKLKVYNYVCEFVSVEKKNDKDMICVKFSDVNGFYPIEKAPVFQQTDTRRKLSKFPGSLINNNKNDSAFDMLEAKKTILTDSIYYITSTGNFKETFSDIKINGKNILDLLLSGTINTENNIKVMNKGQIDGTPALVFTNNLYSLAGYLSENSRYIFIDINNDSIVNSQLDALDNIINRNIPVVVVVDAVNSFNLGALEDRDFLTLRWDKNSIIHDLYNVSSMDAINTRIYNCSNKEIHYELCENHEITCILNNLKKLRRCLDEYTQDMADVYWQLYSISIFLLRNTIKLPLSVNRDISQKIADIEKTLKTHVYNISEENMNIMVNTAKIIKDIISESYIFEKARKTGQLIADSIFENIVIIITDNEDKNIYIPYWNDYIKADGLNKSIRVMHTQEYYNRAENVDAIIIVCGWVGKKKMRNIIFSNNAPVVYILLNKIELYWKKAHSAEWDKVIENESRRNFDKNIMLLAANQTDSQIEILDEEYDDDIDSIEKAIQENRFKKYCSRDDNDSKSITVDAVPVTFVSGYFSFYKKASKLITVTEIIHDISENAREIVKLATEIETGDFVVMREKERSLIHELADDILEKEGKKDYRELSGRWKKGLGEKRAFCSSRELYELIKKDGLSVGLQTFRNWVDDDDFIAPREKENLLFIAVALNDTYLINNIDKIYEICKYVRTAHVKAGNIISKRLKNSIAKVLGDMPKVKRVDIWDPIDIQLEELGKVKILKVTDIGNIISVDIMHTNKLLRESSAWMSF
jgi:hypothetical protein